MGYGTLNFMSPEQKKSHKQDFSTDIYSLGVVILMLLKPMLTSMENIRTLNEAKKGGLPSDLKRSTAQCIV